MRHDFLIRHFADGEHSTDLDEFATDQDVIDLIVAHNTEDDWDTIDSARVIVQGGWSSLNLGPEEDRDVVTRLKNPVYHNTFNGEFYTEEQISDTLASLADPEPFDCISGVDYPITLR